MSESKLDSLTRLVRELEEGKDREAVLKEYGRIFGKEAADKLLDPRKAGTKPYDGNPLVLRAEENGALRALLESIKKDFASEKDSIRNKRLSDEFSRLQGLSLHYSKVKEMLLPLLSDLPMESKKEIIQDEEDAIELVRKCSSLLEKGDDLIRAKTLPSLFSLLELNRKNENCYLLPLLDERLNDRSLYLLKKNRDRKGYFLIRYPLRKDESD